MLHLSKIKSLSSTAKLSPGSLLKSKIGNFGRKGFFKSSLKQPHLKSLKLPSLKLKSLKLPSLKLKSIHLKGLK